MTGKKSIIVFLGCLVFMPLSLYSAGIKICSTSLHIKNEKAGVTVKIKTNLVELNWQFLSIISTRRAYGLYG